MPTSLSPPAPFICSILFPFLIHLFFFCLQPSFFFFPTSFPPFPLDLCSRVHLFVGVFSCNLFSPVFVALVYLRPACWFLTGWRRGLDHVLAHVILVGAMLWAGRVTPPTRGRAMLVRRGQPRGERNNANKMLSSKHENRPIIAAR